jgi:DNA-binding MarR family transcriptional regulator
MSAGRTESGPGNAGAERSAVLLARLGRLAARRLNEQLAATGLKPSHAAILILLRDAGPMSQRELGERLHVDPSNLVVFLNALEEDGLVARRRDPDDRRRHIVEATAEGVKRVPICDDAVDALEEELFAELSPDDRERLHTMLRSLSEAAPREPAATDA